jgi:hypothetical protein
VSLKLEESPVAIENPALRYVYQSHFADDVFTHTTSLLLKQKDVAVSELDDYLSALKEIRKDWEYTLTVVNPDAIPGQSDLQNLKALLNDLSGNDYD